MPALVRPARFAGLFYPQDRDTCGRLADCLLDCEAPSSTIGGLVPHAGWRYSGPTAGRTVRAIGGSDPETIIVFGAVHVPNPYAAAVYPSGEWETPLGRIKVDDELARAIARHSAIEADPRVHEDEHSIEVELPLLQRCLAGVRFLPVMVRPCDHAAKIGQICAQEALSLGRRVVILASTDLTHYGPRFGFEPAGRGEPGIRWAKEVNDRRFIDLVAKLDESGVVPEALRNQNACGAGAVAAAISAAKVLSAVDYKEIEHTSSAEREGFPSIPVSDSVGYHSGIFVKSAGILVSH